MKRHFCADFETTTFVDDCRVWAWGAARVCDEPEETFVYGTDIDGFMEWALEQSGARIWFHNLKFDGGFIMSWLLNHGYDACTDMRPPAGKFSATIDELGKVYRIEVAGVEFADSYKKITMSVRAAAKTYGLEMTKGELDYETFRPVGHELTVEELDYLSRDVLIMSRAMSIRLSGGSKLTTASDCLACYKDLAGRAFRAVFPVINPVIDERLRKAYRGGWVYVNPRHKGEDAGRGIRLDVNSLYPWAMRYNPLPVGAPQYFAGEPSPTEERPLWIAEVEMTARLRPGKLPCIQARGASLFGEREYLEHIDAPTRYLVCSVDWALWCEMYEIDVWGWFGGWSFREQSGLFDEYIDTYMQQKQDAETPGARALAKLYLNGLYGKLAQKINAVNRVPYLGEDGELKFREAGTSEREPVYLPGGIFITAYARGKTIRTACEFGERFCYADTDSIHAIGEDIPEDVEVHPKKLGAWKLEATFERARFVRAKTYAETVGGVDEYTCAGMSDALKAVMRFEDFKSGFTTRDCPFFLPGGCGKDCAACYDNVKNWGLRPKQVRGGVVLVPSPFSIK